MLREIVQGSIFYLILLALSWAFRWMGGIIGSALVLGAHFFNGFIVYINDDRMPSRLGEKEGYVKISSSTRLIFLGDVISARARDGRPGYMSVGDILGYAGIATIVISALVKIYGCFF
jgi:hypothetical protein